MNRLIRWFLWSVAALLPLSVVEVALGITHDRLGGWFHAYIVASTVLIMAIVWRALYPPRNDRRPSP